MKTNDDLAWVDWEWVERMREFRLHKRTGLTAEQRRERARMGGLATAAAGHVNTGPARAAYWASFSSEEERRAHFAEMGRLRWDPSHLKQPRKQQSRRRVGTTPPDPLLRLMQAVFGKDTRIRWSLPADHVARAHRARVWP